MDEYKDDLFSEEHNVSGPSQRRILDALTRVWQNLQITDAEGKNVRNVTVMEPPEGEHYRIEVHQSIQSDEYPTRLTKGQSVRVINSDDGVAIGAWGQIESVATYQTYFAYTLTFVGDTYRQERRNAFRVPIESGDSLDAYFILKSKADAIKCSVRDLSMTGAWLELSEESSIPGENAMTFNTHCNVGLQLPGQKDIVYSDALLVWTDPSNDSSLHIGVTWSRPTPEFKRDLRRFVMNKERELAKRRSRT